MSVAVSYPGVYIQEVSSGVATITGVATSIGAFVDCFAAGPMNVATEVFSFADFESQFGGLDATSEASYGIQQFFANGGTQAYVVRVTSSTQANAAAPAAIALEDKAGGSTTLTAAAASPGAWGNNIRIDVDYGATDPTSQFNLTVTEVSVVNGVTSVVATEKYLNLVVDSSSSQDAAAVVNAASQLITLSEAASPGPRPASTGTTSNAITNANAAAAWTTLGLAATDTITVTLGGTAIGTTAALGTLPATPTLSWLANALQGLLRGLQSGAGLPNATVTVVGSSATTAYLVVKSGTKPSDYLVLSGSLATKLGFAAATENVQQYALGGGAAQAQALPGNPAAQQTGKDDAWNLATDAAGITSGLIGDPNAKTGIYALMNVDLFNILCIPATMNLPDVNAAAVATAATNLCQTRRAMYVLDVPVDADSATSILPVMNWLDSNAGLRSRNAALYFPRLMIPDPLNSYRLRAVGSSGTIAGLWARTDGQRGVWKAPAGTAATLTGVQSLEYLLTDPENGVLNPLAINCLRNFPIYGPVCWGARTLYGADQMADDYKYVPVRRLALFIEESLYRGTQWVVFEPNDTPLWAAIRLNVGAFMQTLFRQGAFQGTTPQQAYFVLCDATNNPQSSIDLGIVNILVGFAPLKPAEFVVITIQQIAGQLAT
jgi:phage tail sheath protein FI